MGNRPGEIAAGGERLRRKRERAGGQRRHGRFIDERRFQLPVEITDFDRLTCVEFVRQKSAVVKLHVVQRLDLVALRRRQNHTHPERLAEEQVRRRSLQQQFSWRLRNGA